MTDLNDLGVRVCTLYSGSGGNSTYIEAAGSRILIDAGKSARALLSSLASIGVFDISDSRRKTAIPPPVDAIFITHEHRDHIAALEVFTKRFPIPIHITEPSAGRIPVGEASNLSRCLSLHPPLYETTVGGLTVSSFQTSHDSRMSVGYRITFHDPEGNPRSIGYATDLGTVTSSVEAGLRGCEAVILESNHDPDMLLDGPYPYDLKLRIKSRHGHLSNPDAAAFGASLAETGTRYFLLAHLSKENNLPLLAKQEFCSALADETITVCVADPAEPTFLLGSAACPTKNAERGTVLC